MFKLILVIIIAIFFWQFSQKQTETIPPSPVFETKAVPISNSSNVEIPTKVETSTQNFKCDGRTHCSQMHSCEEATFFLRNCPNPKMDGDDDGIPCENQWCN